MPAFHPIRSMEITYGEVWIGLEVYNRLGRLSDVDNDKPSKLKTSWRRMKVMNGLRDH